MNSVLNQRHLIGGRGRKGWTGLLMLAVLTGCSELARDRSRASTAEMPERPIYVLFDNTKAETAGNADWVVDAVGRDPGRITPIVPLPRNPRMETDWDGALSAWGVELVRQGVADVNSLPPSGRITYLDPTNPQDLSKYHVFVVCEPNIAFTRAERRAIMAFIHNGGGLFIIANHAGADRNNDGADPPEIWNALFRETGGPRGQLGLWFNRENIRHEDPDVRGDVTDPDVGAILNGPFGSVRGSIIRSGADMIIDPDVNPTVRGVLFRRGFSPQGRSGVFAALCRWGKGRVFAIGDSSPADDGTGDTSDRLFDGWRDPAGTNRELFLNATVWLAGNAVVDEAPTLIGITPNRARAGRTARLLINARKSHFSPGLTTVSLGEGVDIERVTVIDRETLTVTLFVQPHVAGPRTIEVITGDEMLRVPDGFIIDGA